MRITNNITTQNALRTLQRWDHEFRVKLADGSRRWLRAELDDAGSAVAFDRALDLALLHLNAPAPTASPTIVITSGAVDVEQVLHDVRAALSAPGKNPGAADLGPT